MSPAARSKSKEKKTSKESQRGSNRITGPANAAGGVPTSVYDPLLGTFHTLDPAMPMPSAPYLHINGRFRSIDETDEHCGNSTGSGAEYDSISNNGSSSGESEDHKEKTASPPIKQETIPGADNGKREKIRQKNERKHQRQKEKRAQELHDRCSGYLMSRKLEALAQQLVAMGFSSERATMSLMLNEGRVEESVTWLFEGHEEVDEYRDQNLADGNNLKIDISEELARIVEMEIRFKCSKQEVERVVVACEGDLEKAAGALRVQKQEPPAASSKPEETIDHPPIKNGRLSVAPSQNLVRSQTKSNPSSSIQQRRNERDLNYSKATVTVRTPSDLGSKNVQTSRKLQPKLDLVRPQQTATMDEKRWPVAESNPSISYSSASSVQPSPQTTNVETSYMTAGNEPKILKSGPLKEPVIMMQRSKSIKTKQMPATSISLSPPGTAAGWYPNSIEITHTNGVLPHIPSTRNISPSNPSSNQLYQQIHYGQHQQFVPGSGPVDLLGTNQGNGSWSTTGTSTLAAASSLGLFSGVGLSSTSDPSSAVEWNTSDSMQPLDYTSIDWSLDRGLPSLKPNGSWLGMASFAKNDHMYESHASAVGLGPPMRLIPSHGNGVPFSGLQDAGAATVEASAGGSREWTSPFEGKDLFSLPRQFVSSPFV
ncbi:uncharacterized protein LOC131148554 [Malania oleifera]|uniref:uncharacterized protein LOC131148554 n=1 Tax=Malania oleifera TaxID=397392 RepID=UPI0025AE5D42|nr:uncharacterized protein LOC131148554 [Malania oleifera]